MGRIAISKVLHQICMLILVNFQHQKYCVPFISCPQPNLLNFFLSLFCTISNYLRTFYALYLPSIDRMLILKKYLIYTEIVIWLHLMSSHFILVFDSDNIFPRRLTPEVLQALRGVRFIAQHIKDADKDNEIVQDWKFVSMVLDRFFLWVFTLSCVGGTLGIILQSPSLSDTRPSLAPGIHVAEKPGLLHAEYASELRHMTIFDDPIGL